MAVFQMFSDAGGDSEDPTIRVLSVAGWIATEAQWRRLEREWRKICDREGVSGLHMKEFAHSVGEYHDWKENTARRKRFLSDLAGVIKRYTTRDFSISLFLDGYRAVNAQYEFVEHVGHPYMIAAWALIQDVRRWMVKMHPADDVMFVFEKGDSYQEELIHLIRRDKIDLGIEPLFMKKRWVVGDVERTMPALECADFLAYEHHKNLTDMYLHERTKGRGSLSALGLDRNWRWFDGQLFERYAKDFNVPRRIGVPMSPIPHESDSFTLAQKHIFEVGDLRVRLLQCRDDSDDDR